MWLLHVFVMLPARSCDGFSFRNGAYSVQFFGALVPTRPPQSNRGTESSCTAGYY